MADLLEALQHIDPASCSYQEWVNVGMALAQEGYAPHDWEEWSARDAARYHPGECDRKWPSFRGAETPITGATVIQMAMDRGWRPADGGHELGWEDAIGGGREEGVVLSPDWLEGVDVQEPGSDWDPVRDLITYLETLFEAGENVGYVTASWHNGERYVPSRGSWDRTAGQLIEQLSQCGGDIGAVLGDYNPDVGAWIRFNPLDGSGCKNENVTDYRFALVESDSMDLARQRAAIAELELPVAALVYSGGKSLHAIVRIDAKDYAEYRQRVDYLYSVLKRNGLSIDTQNKNPSRLSRMPGVTRGAHKQFLLGTNLGRGSWQEWHEWIESVNDSLPDPEGLDGVWDHLPELSPPLIDGILRQGHKMLLAGPSKAGKSFLLIELVMAIAEGRPWLGFPCAQGRVLYVNLELDRASCLHRFRDVYAALGWQPTALANIDIWNLRGQSLPMDKLAPKLIRRAAKKRYAAIVIDPIYKVITGDENSADQMARFCNQFDLICTQLGAAVIYCHHHSKGAQGGKRAMDRASGSGVFARDPDALLDLIELEISDKLRADELERAQAAVCCRALDAASPYWRDHTPDQHSHEKLMQAVNAHLSATSRAALDAELAGIERVVRARTAWRIDGTLREFAKFAPVNLWFDYPAHRLDDVGVLQDADVEGAEPGWKKAVDARRKARSREKLDARESFELAVSTCNFGEPPTIEQLVEATGRAERTIRDQVKKFGFWVDKNDGTIHKKE